MSAASSDNESCRYAYSFHVRAFRPFRTSPGGRRFPSDPSKVLAQMRLVHKSTSKRNVAQRHIGLKHVRGSHPMRRRPQMRGRVPECAPKGARKCASLRHTSAHRSATSTRLVIWLSMYSSYLRVLPCEQTLFSVVRRYRLWIDLPSQQRGCLSRAPCADSWW